MLFKDIKNITVGEMVEASKKGLYFKICDGKIKGFMIA